jgi:adenylate cyclase
MSKAIKAFAAFVPVDLVRELISSEKGLETGGHSRFLTIMFTDLEAFSTLSENRPSHELLQQVSSYLGVCSRIIAEERGTVDKFIGDAVMAFWGAPNELEDHALRACVAAMRIQQAMDQLNAQWKSEGLPELKVRIGIHSDAVLVGNIGSTDRMSYTVMGDGVNVASRLEGLNKNFGTRTCISKTVYREAGERLLLRPLGEMEVKGRKSMIEVYELQGLK